jgi:L-fucose isomerase-like protein
MKKVGFVNLCHEDYIDDNVTGIADLAVKGLREHGIEVVVTDKPASSGVLAMQAGIELAGMDLDGIIVFLGAWMECATAMCLIREIEHIPFCLWGFPMFMEDGKQNSTGSYVSYAMFKGTLVRAGYNFRSVLGMPEEAVFNKVTCFCRAASVVKKLKRCRAGLVGYTSMSIYPGTFDHLFMRTKIGPEIHHIDSYSVICRAEAIGIEERKAAADEIRGMSCVSCDVSDESLEKAAGIYAALKEICKTYRLDAINVKCQYEFSKEYKMVACVPLSALADTGVVSSCEGDIMCTVSMLILALLTGNVVTYGDAINHIDNVIKLSSCGFLPFSMGCGKRQVQNFMPHPGFTGIQTSFVMRPEKVTVMRLIEDCGCYHMLYFTGQGMETELRQGCMPALDVRVDGDIDTIVENYSGQHFAICYGDLSDEIEEIARMLKIRTIRA